jgi:hypothetical protein
MALSFSGLRRNRAKTWVQDDVQSENVTFFSARCLAGSWAQSSGTSLGGTMGDDNLTCNASYLKDNTFRCRIIRGKKARTSSAGLTQLAKRKEEKSEQATATDGSD